MKSIYVPSFGTEGRIHVSGTLDPSFHSRGRDKNQVKKTIPFWVLNLCGLMFIIAGIMMPVIRRAGTFSKNIFGAFILTIMCTIAGWIAFGPGPRMFNGGSVSPIIGRMVFGFGAIVIFFLTGWALSMAYHDDPVEPGKSVEMPNGVLIVLLIAVITEIIVFRNFLLPDGSWNI